MSPSVVRPVTKQQHQNRKSRISWTTRLVVFAVTFTWLSYLIGLSQRAAIEKSPSEDHDFPFQKQSNSERRSNGTSSFGSRQPILKRAITTTNESFPDLTQDGRKIKILLTDYGWNSPDPAIANDRFRTLRSTAMFEAIRRHPGFDAHLWRNITSRQVSPDPYTHYYVFLDLETCLEKNWPYYGYRLDGNTDLEGGRSGVFRWSAPCNALKEVANSILFTSDCCWAKMVLFDCGGYGPEHCLSRSYKARNKRSESNKKKPPQRNNTWFALVSISANVQQIDSSLDQGLPPPPIVSITPEHGLAVNRTRNSALSDRLEEDMKTVCDKKRPIFVFFAGNFRSSIRQALYQMHDPNISMITNPDYRKMRKGGFSHFYNQLLPTRYGAVPRGDNLFSYRFTEVLAAGAIPVVYADGWVLPFRPELVEWKSCCAIVIPEAQINRTYEILTNISKEEECRLRRNGHRIFHKYMETTDGVVAGILEGLELVAKKLVPMRAGS